MEFVREFSGNRHGARPRGVHVLPVTSVRPVVPPTLAFHATNRLTDSNWHVCPRLGPLSLSAPTGDSGSFGIRWRRGLRAYVAGHMANQRPHEKAEVLLTSIPLPGHARSSVQKGPSIPG